MEMISTLHTALDHYSNTSDGVLCIIGYTQKEPKYILSGYTGQDFEYYTWTIPACFVVNI